MTALPQTPHSLRVRRACAAAVTLGNALCGFAAMAVAVLAPKFGHAPAAWVPWAVAAVFAAWAFDMADGIVARRLKATSPFGAMLDSLADVVSFGMAPAILLLSLASGDARDIALRAAAAVIYLGAAILRLARFTAAAADAERAPTSTPRPARRFFTGLPSPAAAMTLASILLLHDAVPEHAATLLATGGGAALGALMISRLRYLDVAGELFRGTVPRWPLAALPLAWAALGLTAALPAVLGLYIASGLLVRRP